MQAAARRGRIWCLGAAFGGLIAAGLGTGYVPVAGGTVASAAALVAGAGLLAVSHWLLLLAAIEELGTAEIAEVLGRSESAVRALLFRARTRLRERLERGDAG